MRGMRTCTCGELASENTATALGLTTHHRAQAPAPSAERVISDNTRAVDGEYRAQPNAPDASLCVAGASLFLVSGLHDRNLLDLLAKGRKANDKLIKGPR